MVNLTGTARSNCFRCQKQDLACDRAKPRCKQCIDSGIVCPGYRQQLSWNNGLASRGRLRGKSLPVEEQHQHQHFPASIYNSLSWKLDAHRVTKRPYRRNNTVSSPENVSKDVNFMSMSMASAPLAEDHEFHQIYDFSTEGFSPVTLDIPNVLQNAVYSAVQSAPGPFDVLTLSPSSSSASSSSSPILSNSTEPNADSQHHMDLSSKDPSTTDQTPRMLASGNVSPTGLSPRDTSLGQLTPLLSYSLPPELPDLWKELLHDYTNSFCGTPVTADFANNPYRAAISLAMSSKAVLHAILGFSIHHSNLLKGENPNQQLIATHREMSLRELQGTLSKDLSTGFITIMLLITLDSTQSAIGQWESLIKSSSDILRSDYDNEVIQGQEGLSRLAMLLWFDLTVALISRKSNQIDQMFYTMLLSKNSELSHKDFFNLVGCDKDIFGYLIRLVDSVKSLKQGNNILKVLQDTQDIKTGLLHWTVPEELHIDKLLGQTGNKLQISLDKVHCIEAWRWAALLYIEQVFNGATEADYYKHQVFDHVRCISRVDVVQKQVLLPLFLVGAQACVQEEHIREFITEYCSYWGQTCRFKMFNTMGHMLDLIWEKLDGLSQAMNNSSCGRIGDGSYKVFWGDVLDETNLGSILLG